MWFLMIFGQISHAGFKVMQQTTDAKFAVFWTNPRNWFIFFTSLTTSIAILIAGYYSYADALERQPAVAEKLDMYVYGAAFVIGYAGSSFMTNVMPAIVVWLPKITDKILGKRLDKGDE